LHRSQAYIGVLIDDLITKEIYEPYRMFTSLAEYRLLLRQDNADLRLTEYGHKLGLIPEEYFLKVKLKRESVHQFINEFKKIRLSPENANPILETKSSATIAESESLFQLLKRPNISIQDFNGIIDNPIFSSNIEEKLKTEIREQVEIEIKYEGYFQRQQEQVSRFEKLENQFIPETMNFDQIESLSNEAREKLKQIRPMSLGQASRIAGVSPADIAVLMVFLKRQ
jgi:tRNA uridine 5-carboxymethylaminomethyl modification enzyme